MILLPRLIVFERAVDRVEVVVIMVGVIALFMYMIEFLTVLMVVQVMAASGVLILVVRNG